MHALARARGAVGAPSFQADLRIPSWPITLLVLVMGMALSVAAPYMQDATSWQRLAVVLYVLCGSAYLLERWKPWAGRWLLVISVAVAIYLAHTWLRIPGFLALLTVPTALTAALMGLPAAVVMALGQSVLLGLGWQGGSVGPGSEVLVAWVAIWSALGVMVAVYMPVFELAQWSWQHFQQAQGLLEESRDRQAKLKQALEDLAAANRQLALLNERTAALRLIAEEAQKTKAAFVANVSHEFRTPLNIIVGLAEIMLDARQTYGAELSASVRRDLRILYRNCEHLSSMINDVLDLSQVEAGRLALHREPVNLPSLIESALNVVRPLLDKKGLSLNVEAPRNLPEVRCDRTRIRQVILNLVSNAARFTEVGGITVRLEPQEQFMLVSVQDSGPGIAPEDLERIFEPFQQGNQALHRQKGGSGLGLAISKQFVELHGGRMWVESKRGIGSTFFFRLPISPLAGPLAPPQRWIAEGYLERRSRAAVEQARLDQRLIVCDGTGELVELFRRYEDQTTFVAVQNLDQAGQALHDMAAQGLVVNAGSPETAWQMVQQATQSLPDLPVVGCALVARTTRATAAGARGYLLKPFNRTQLADMLHGPAGAARRVLVVDDEKDSLELASRMVHACDAEIEVTTAASGAQALREMRSRPPDVVLLDIVMPEMNGWQVLAAKAQDPAIREIPVVILSAQDPGDEPASSPLVLASMGRGLSVSKLLRCSQALATLLLQPD